MVCAARLSAGRRSAGREAQCSARETRDGQAAAAPAGRGCARRLGGRLRVMPKTLGQTTPASKWADRVRRNELDDGLAGLVVRFQPEDGTVQNVIHFTRETHRSC